MKIARSRIVAKRPTDVLTLLLAFFLPPVAVGLRYGFFSKNFLINLLLTALLFLPGVIHAVYLSINRTKTSVMTISEI